MENSAFGTMCFNTGWETQGMISLFGKAYPIVIQATSYYESDDVTEAQESAYIAYRKEEDDISTSIEDALTNLTKSQDEAIRRFVPAALRFEREGSCALLLDDNLDAEGGIAVCIFPDGERGNIIDLDAYL